MTHTLADIKIAVVSGGSGPCSVFTRKSGDAIASALKTFFAHVEHLEFDATLEQRLDTLRPDVVFPAISDVELSKLLETLGLHFVGSGIHANYLVQGKRRMKPFLHSVGVPVEDDITCMAQDDIAKVADKALQMFPGGCLIGSSEGSVTDVPALCKSAGDIAAVFERVIAAGDQAVIGRCFKGWREIIVAVIDDGLAPRVLPITEVIYSDQLLMYSPYDTEYRCPAFLPDEITSKVQRYALETFQALGLKDFSRIDMVVNDEGEVIVQEVDAIPCFSAGSLFVLSAQAAGISIEDLAITMVRRALSRSSNEIKIASRALPPGSVLSNFAPHPFVLDDVEIAGMEGLLQSLKTPDEKLQRELCSLVGKEAKRRGTELDKTWQETQTLWWKGQAMGRPSADYHAFLHRAYNALFDQCKDFRMALEQTGSRTLSHALGNIDPKRTVLTEGEFIEVLEFLRGKLKSAGGWDAIEY